MIAPIDKLGLAGEKAKLLHALEHAGAVPPAPPRADTNTEGGTEPMLSAETVDQHLDAVLRASGSALRHYTMQKTLDDMRCAMRAAIQRPAHHNPGGKS